MGPFMWPRRLPWEGMRREMREMFGGEWPFGPWWAQKRAYPPVNVRENDESVTVEFEIPGIATGDIDLTITGGSVALKVKRAVEGGIPPENYYVRERWRGEFGRNVNLPGALDGERATASYENGVLSVNIPKAAAAKRRKIDIVALC